VTIAWPWCAIIICMNCTSAAVASEPCRQGDGRQAVVGAVVLVLGGGGRGERQQGHHEPEEEVGHALTLPPRSPYRQRMTGDVQRTAHRIPTLRHRRPAVP
jgi:hypothetical protein